MLGVVRIGCSALCVLCWSLFVNCCFSCLLLVGVSRLLFGVCLCWLLFVVCCSLTAVCCYLLFVVCCS